MTGSYEVLQSTGSSTLTSMTTTVLRDFSHTAVGQISAANCGADVRFQAGGTNSGSATELCSGYRGSYTSIGATTRYDLTIRIEVIERGGVGCCSGAQPPVGACTLPGPSCQNLTESACLALGGTWHGSGSICAGSSVVNVNEFGGGGSIS